MIIDLHGKRENEAIGIIYSALRDLENNIVDVIEFIVGRGEVLNGLVIECIEKENLQWEYNGNNLGSIIITR